jgi:4-amino-4-deoxy-L-arabinose transferase-like glycosyltransferase
MPTGLIPRREAWIWASGFLLAASLLVFTRFTSSDPDSALYAGLSARLAQEPLWRWVAPEWWGLWPETGMTGWFREHPAGALFIPAALARLGVPGEQAAYIVGIALGLASVLLIGHLIERVASRDAARAALVLLQIMPVAFLFRIRANHEYAMLVSLLVTLVGLERVRRSWWAIGLVVSGLVGGLLVKGVFVSLTVVGAGLWIVVNPARTPGSAWRPIAATLVGVAALVGVAIAYDAWYRAVTGETYWAAYWERQLGQVDVATPVGGGFTLAGHVWFYLTRLLWHAAPWSLALLALAWSRPTASSALVRHAGHGLRFALLYAACLVLMLSPSSRVAERYIFTGTYAIAAAGVVASLRLWPRFAAAIIRADRRVVALPAFVWMALIVARLAFGPFVPRLSAELFPEVAPALAHEVMIPLGQGSNDKIPSRIHRTS